MNGSTYCYNNALQVKLRINVLPKIVTKMVDLYPTVARFTLVLASSQGKFYVTKIDLWWSFPILKCYAVSTVFIYYCSYTWRWMITAG